MRRKLGVLALATGILLTNCEQRPLLLHSVAPKGAWVSLFNGRNLEGWVPKFNGHPLGDNVKNTFGVEKGRLKVSYDDYERWDDLFGHLFYNVRQFKHYWIRVEYRFVGRQVPGAPSWAWRNNGVMLHAQSPDTMRLDQPFPVSLELRLMGGSWWHRRPPTGSLCFVDTTAIHKGERMSARVVDSDAPSYPGDQWVLAEAEVQGDKVVRHFVNGRQVMEYSNLQLEQSEPWSPIIARTHGFIAIQAESHPTEFRRIEVLDLGTQELGS